MLVDDGTRHRNKIIDRVACVVIGAGVVGLACARALAQRGVEVVILEAQDCFGSETSSRNSEVIHAGIYYQAGSLKAKWCVAGKKALYKYCAEKHIPHKSIGKLIVATSDAEVATLQDIDQRARANGVNDLEFLNSNQVHALEPELHAFGGLFSPSTGIIDSHSFMLALLGDAEAAGAMLALNSKVIAGTLVDDGVELEIVSNGQTLFLHAEMVINSAGLHASAVARSIRGIPPDQIVPTYFRKGSYFTYAARNPFKHLIYPVPVPGGLGTHSTVDLAGQVRFGPDVQWIEEHDYAVDPNKRAVFADAIRRYWPAVQTDLLQPGYSGIRPSLNDQTSAGFKDFVLHEYDNVISLFGIESPGLTASLSIADAVTAAVRIKYVGVAVTPN